MASLQSLTQGALELRLRRTIAQAMTDGDFQKELEGRRLLADLLNPVDYQAQLAERTGPLEAAMVAAGGEAQRLSTGAQRLAGKLTGDQAMVDQTRAVDAERQAALNPLNAAHPIATAVGEMLPGMAVPGGAAGGLARRGLTAAAAGLGYEGLASGGDLGLGDAAAIAGLSAAGSAAGDVLGRGLAGRPGIRAGRTPIPAEHTAMVGAADALGYRTTPGERQLNTTLQKLEAGWERNPYMGRAFDALREGNKELATNIARRALGITTPGKITDEVLEASHERIGKALRGAAGDAELELDDEVLDRLANVAADIKKTIASTNGDEIEKLVDKFLGRMAQSPTMSVDEYLKQVSDLATKGRQAYAVQGKSDVSQAAYALREILDDAFDRVGGDTPALREARGQWRALKELEAPGVLRQGDLSAPTLYNKLKRLQGGRVRGDRELDEVARIGHHFASTVPNSGTPTGMAMQNYMGASLPTKAAMLAGGGLGAGYLSPLGRAAMGPGLLGYPLEALNLAPVEGLLNASPTLLQRAGRQYGMEEQQQPREWGLPLL
jgi:hypothetical protein